MRLCIAMVEEVQWSNQEAMYITLTLLSYCTYAVHLVLLCGLPMFTPAHACIN